MSLDSLQHVVVGGGHFVDRGGRLIQEVLVHQERLLEAANRAFAFNEYRLPENVQVGRRLPPTLNTRALVLAADIESSAWRDYQERDWDRLVDVGRETALSIGCGLAGDTQGAVEHGAAAVEQLFDPYVKTVQDIWTQVGTLMTTPDRDR